MEGSDDIIGHGQNEGDSDQSDPQEQIDALSDRITDLERIITDLRRDLENKTHQLDIATGRAIDRIGGVDNELKLQRDRIDILYRRQPQTTDSSASTPGDCDEWEVEADGGGAGDALTDTLTTTTYTLKDKNSGAVIASSIPLTGRGQRLFPIQMNNATRGRGYYDEDGNPVLTWVDETMDQVPCEE